MTPETGTHDRLPSGYVELDSAEAGGFALSAASPWAIAVLASGRTLHSWAAEADGVEAFSGRGTAYAVPAPTPGPDDRSRWAVRHYRRGGAIAVHLGDRYLASNETRPRRELAASAAARSRGVPTPAVVAGVCYPAGMFYRADLVTEMVPNAMSLADILFHSESPLAARMAHLESAGRLVRLLEEAGIAHADLNAMNILIQDETGAAHVIDLDRCRVLRPGAPATAMRQRLERSLRKLGATTDRDLAVEGWHALRAGFETKP